MPTYTFYNKDTDEQFDEYYYLLHPQERISFGGFAVKMSKKAIKTNQKKRDKQNSLFHTRSLGHRK